MTSTAAACAAAFRRERLSLDSQEHASELSGWEQNYEQISRGAFRSRLVEVELEGMQIFQEEISQAVFQTGRCRAGSVVLGVFSALSGEARWHGGTVGLDDVLCLEGCGELVLSTPQTSCLLAVGMPVDSLGEWCDEGFSLEVPRRLSGVPLRDQRAAENLRRHLTRAIGELLRWPGEHLPQAAARALRDELTLLAVELLQGEGAPAGTLRASARAKQVVRRAREFALERRDDPPSLLDVCRHAHVSPRTLQNCFESVLGDSPATCLKMLRLNGARRELLRAGAQAKVSDVAANWGFWHLSQFSADYRRMFGELPSATRPPRRATWRGAPSAVS